MGSGSTHAQAGSYASSILTMGMDEDDPGRGMKETTNGQSKTMGSKSIDAARSKHQVNDLIENQTRSMVKRRLTFPTILHW